MRASDSTTTLDWEQLRDVTLGDADLIREILETLIEDSSRQIRLLETAIRQRDPETTMRLAHYSKGACANVGARAAAAALLEIERRAARSEFGECGASLAVLAREVDRLRAEIAGAPV
ncbi:MAG: Hpt domain-containing protein [Acidobacteriia bacterium]|nr:Hpt domain-containing protein [Terriglobia bacterium]